MAQTIGRRWRAFRRTTLVGAASGVALLGGLAPATQASGSTSAPHQAPFSNGMAKATAVVVKVAPGVGSLELALGSGVGRVAYVLDRRHRRITADNLAATFPERSPQERTRIESQDGANVRVDGPRMQRCSNG